MSIGYVNICSSVQDHRQKFECLLNQASVLEEQMRAIETTKRKLVLLESV